MPRGKEKKKQDEFVSWTMHAFEYIRLNAKRIVAVVSIVAVVFVIVLLVAHFREGKATKAANEFYKAQQLAEDKQFDALKEVAEDYSGSIAGHLAMFDVADKLFKKGEYEAATNEFGKLVDASKRQPLIQVAALHKKARSLFALGKIEDAAKTYIAASEIVGNLNKSDSLYQAGRCYEELKNFDQAKSFYEKSIEAATGDGMKARPEERLLWLIGNGWVAG